MTPIEAATLANNFLGIRPDDNKKILDFIKSASPRDIQEFIHHLDYLSGLPRYFEIAKVSIEIQLSENSDFLAEKLSNQTDRLIKYTISLRALTIVIAVFALIQIVVMIMDYCSKTH
jgi:hypothetical protein